MARALRADEPAVSQQVIETAELVGRGRVGQTRNGFGILLAAMGVGAPQPDAPALLGVVEPIAPITGQRLDFSQADPADHPTGGEVIRPADHLDQVPVDLRGLFQGTVFEALEGRQQDHQLRQAGAIHHGVAVHLGKARRFGV